MPFPLRVEFGARPSLLLLLLLRRDTYALFNGEPVRSSSDVPGVTGSLFSLYEDSDVHNCISGDEKIAPHCTGGLISPGIFLTAAHCLQEEITGKDARAFARLRVALGRKITYQNDDGSCAGRALGTDDNIYKVRAAFWPKDFKAFEAERDGIFIAMDHLDYAVLYLDTCATSATLGNDRPMIAGAAFADYDNARGGGPGFATSFWGYGENEMGDSNYDGIARFATYTFTRVTSRSGAAGKKKMWIDCHWLPDSASTWQHSEGLAAAKDTLRMVATPNLMCAASNPMTIRLCAQITTRTDCLNAMKTTKAPIQSFCEWKRGECNVNQNVGGGNGVVTLPAPGGGDSGGAYWVKKGSTYVHVGIIMGGSELYPRWAIVSKTDYMQNWLLAALDRDTCISGSSLDYFDAFDGQASNLHPHATTDFVGGLA
eukprot:CAMPEP_0119358504 /NCGR_PEP_ID=MMETSP1334-20130426/6702_1 /TAXON_ID=127549 /ORGANISM="Calcidiscus leptoporus, Strain RCC1130" /LENGTH=427 /DNA_ID=CAMNT_0007373019 /DNA_START=185 /DNA_END=1464 /DNA_ORIENTATION=+